MQAGRLPYYPWAAASRQPSLILRPKPSISRCPQEGNLWIPLFLNINRGKYVIPALSFGSCSVNFAIGLFASVSSQQPFRNRYSPKSVLVSFLCANWKKILV